MSQLGFSLVEDPLGHFVEATFVIRCRPVSKKNEIKIQRHGPHASIGHTTKYNNWERNAVSQLTHQWQGRQPLDERVKREANTRQPWLNVRITNHLAKDQSPDASNLYEGPQDVLQLWLDRKRNRPGAGVVVNDYWFRGHDGSDRVPWKEHKSEPRVEITVTRWKR